MKIIYLLTTILFTHFAFGQEPIKIQGTTIDTETGKPIPFVNIVLKNHSRGLMSNDRGYFQMSIDESMLSDTLLFSCMGYKLAKEPLTALALKSGVIKMHPHAFELNELVVTPLTPEEYIRRAVEKISVNYADNPSISSGYYYELVSENSRFLKFEEAVTDTWIPAVNDTAKAHSSVLYARMAKDLVTLQFMQAKRDKQAAKKSQKELKEKSKKNADNNVAVELGDASAEVIATNFGGPAGVLNSDPARNHEEFMKPENFKKFEYSFEPQIAYGDKTLIVIGFKQKKKIEQTSTDGKVYIDLLSDAIVAVEYTGVFHVPTAIKPVLFALGYGIDDPTFNSMVLYRQQDDKWHVNSVKQDIKVALTKKYMFKKNETSIFDIEQAYVVNQLKTNNAAPIAKEFRLKSDKTMTEQARNKDTSFWDNYTTVRPQKLENYLKQ